MTITAKYEDIILNVNNVRIILLTTGTSRLRKSGLSICLISGISGLRFVIKKPRDYC